MNLAILLDSRNDFLTVKDGRRHHAFDLIWSVLSEVDRMIV
jgi:hypothetical protein